MLILRVAARAHASAAANARRQQPFIDRDNSRMNSARSDLQKRKDVEASILRFVIYQDTDSGTLLLSWFKQILTFL